MIWDTYHVRDPSIPEGLLPISSVVWTSSSRASNLLQKVPVLLTTFSEGRMTLLLVHTVSDFQLPSSTDPGLITLQGSGSTHCSAAADG